MTIVLKKSNVKRFFDFMNERHAIYLRRAAGEEFPWTNDPILQKYKFTNIYRELDKGTVWNREKIREPYNDHPELFFNLAAYRCYNLESTQAALGFIENYDAGSVVSKLHKLSNAGMKVFTGAYVITGTLQDEEGNYPDKVTQVFGIMLNQLWNRRVELEPQPGDTLHSAFTRIAHAVKGMGKFITYEIISDLRWTRYLNTASDIMEWANPGPGAKRGMLRLMGAQIMHRWEYSMPVPSDTEIIAAMQHLLKVSPDYLAEWMDPLEMREIEHSLCEWDKHERVRLGQGRPRSLFIPPNMRK